MPKIAFITSEFNHKLGKPMGGLGNVAAEMINYFMNRNIQIYVFSLSMIKSNKVVVMTENNIKYHWFPEQMIRGLNMHDFNSSMCNLCKYISEYIQSTYLIRDPNYFHILHVHDWMVIRVLLELNSYKYPNLRRILHMHSSEYGRNGNKMIYEDTASMERYNLEMVGCHAADLVIPVSDTFGKEIIDMFLISPTKVTTVYN